MDLDAPLDITIGPYETYNDELFGYKAAFEAYVTSARRQGDRRSSKFFADHMQDVENNLPIDPQVPQPQDRRALADPRGQSRSSPPATARTASRPPPTICPTTSAWSSEKGSKRVMLKNVQEAKFRTHLVPIAKPVLPQAAQADLSFDSFFTHILAHEMSHGIGPHQITVDGRDTTPRQEIKELYSAIEEAKADVTGLFMLQYLFDHGCCTAAAMRSATLHHVPRLRFPLLCGSDCTRRTARAWRCSSTTCMDKGAFVANADGTFAVDFAKIKSAVRDLTHDLLTIEAHGDYAGAKAMLDTLGS